MSPARPYLLIAGCGYVGQRLAARLRDRFEIAALVRSNDKAAALQRQGLKPVVIDLDRVRAGASIPERLDQEAIVYLAPPPATGESDLRLDRFLQLAIVPPKTFVYMSTTGVYGDAGGGFVDESTPVMPRTDRARRRVSAEEMTRVWCHERRVRRVVLRVPGIYGPERLPLERLRQSEPVVRPEDAGISNRIHVDDLVTACEAAIMNKEARGVYNVTDGTSISATTFIDMVAELTGLPKPPRVTMEEAQLTFSPERLSFLNESRRVGNDRMLKHLGVKLRYADPVAGIRASLEG
ncbi:NAD-dependent epimerase/dehydratase family protein [Steroidobacter sp. S1-65]|uniref:NAD-dependent epimerase/dehydratase family protein n=1 Tax=Steroidobacter gossypii TaxID=2805490 RepID=A0ABS1WTL9_9GAMM|nr:NAD-dependent epimerase/dehydratase family protein [Steroidobacter gossypii]MBM0104322.1 NAD-dependent epimerase/dehydratase family protein [Steroidobacter gossypii]